MVPTATLLILSSLCLVTVSSPAQTPDAIAPTAEIADSAATPVLTVLDSCAARLDELSRAVRENPTTINGMDIEELYQFLLVLEDDIDSSEAGRLEGMVARAREVYTLHLINLDVLPADLAPSLLLDELDAGMQDSSEVADTLTVEQTFEDTLTSVRSENAVSNGTFDITIQTGRLTPQSALPSAKNLPPIPMVYNAQVERVVDYYSRKGRKVVQRWFERSAEMMPRILPILREEGMPDELAYLAMIESGFNPHAYSRARATGVWQFIPATGRRYGLRNNWWYDERRDPELSTRAAAAYLRELYAMFGDWYLAMAAYNCGERKVEKHVLKYGNDFWGLRRLPRQTRNYVPSYLAAAHIGQDPARYGFYQPNQVPPPETETVYISGSIDLGAVAEAAGISLEEFKELNPAFLRWCTPPDMDSIALHLPVGASANGFWERFAQIPEEKKVSFTWHRVRSGETLSTIARHYGVSVAMIADYPQNKIHNVNRLSLGQMLAIPGVAPGRKSAVVVEPAVTAADGYHTVRKGDSLQSIARRYGVTIAQLRTWNDLAEGALIYPKQKLRVSGIGDTVGIVAVVQEDVNNGYDQHLVRSGDTLWDIARRYGVTIEQIKQANGLGRRSLIKPGQRLLIPAKNKT